MESRHILQSRLSFELWEGIDCNQQLLLGLAKVLIRKYFYFRYSLTVLIAINRHFLGSLKPLITINTYFYVPLRLLITINGYFYVLLEFLGSPAKACGLSINFC